MKLYILFLFIYTIIPLTVGFINSPINKFKRYYKYWTPSSWKQRIQYQLPIYKNNTELNEVKTILRNYSPLVFAGECRELKHEIAKVTCGQSFLLIGGDCAESFDDFSVNSVRDTYKLLLQMALILTYGSEMPVVKIGRMAGQFAKPRSNDYETINNITLPVYRGDIINDVKFNELDRTPDPKRMLHAYHISSQILNILRAFSSGGFADLNNLDILDLKFILDTPYGNKYKTLTKKIEKCMKFMKAIGVNLDSPIFKTTKIYTAHECLLLPYEETLTRKDSITNEWYDCSAHLLWIGERTRQLNGSHIEFIKGINNPIGVKISSNFNASEVIEMIKILNPDNELGRLIIITRMGAEKLKIKLPELITLVKNHSLNVAWCCDPVHGNTFEVCLPKVAKPPISSNLFSARNNTFEVCLPKVAKPPISSNLFSARNNTFEVCLPKDNSINKIKTRSFQSILDEINVFFDIHRQHGTHPGGIHLELTGLNVTECIGGYLQDIKEQDLITNYLSNCDPRLNGMQALEIALLLADKLSN